MNPYQIAKVAVILFLRWWLHPIRFFDERETMNDLFDMAAREKKAFEQCEHDREAAQHLQRFQRIVRAVDAEFKRITSSIR